jgi:sugar-specific transcriptional regulator TrmB
MTDKLTDMTIRQLVRLGLTESLAAAYLTLLQNGQLRPPELAELNNETRTNAYSLLDKLVELKLARKVTTDKKTIYEAENPVAFEKFIERQREEMIERERVAKDTLPELMNIYQLNSEKPGIRFYQGKDGITEIYKEQVREGRPITYIRSRAEIDFLGFRFTHNIRILAPQAGIRRHAFTPDSPEVPINLEENDKKYLLKRTWYKPEDYTAPVEWSVFGNKVAAVSFGKEAIGMIIDSPQIAESLRQIFTLLDEGLKRRDDYDTLPRRAELTDVNSFVAKYNDRAPKIDITGK